MRTEKEMMDLIINTAREDERILAVYMNGSRTNKNASKDIFQDYDIVYVVSETKPFYEEEGWIDRFGKRLYMQMPEKMDYLRGKEGDPDQLYGWLIQFADGNRLDLHVATAEHALKDIHSDRLCEILLNKNHILPGIAESSDRDHWVKRPSEIDFQCDCNDFWWCLNNVAKGLWRGEIPYVMDMVNLYIRPHLVQLLSWKIGIENDFACSIGKSGKYMYRFLEAETWQRFLDTYSNSEVINLWEATFSMCDLFDETAREVADGLDFSYNQEEARASRGFLSHVRRLPKDVDGVY